MSIQVKLDRNSGRSREIAKKIPRKLVFSVTLQTVLQTADNSHIE